MEIVKIRTKRGKIITLTVEKKTEFHYIGVGKFGEDVILPIDEIDSLETLRGGLNGEGE